MTNVTPLQKPSLLAVMASKFNMDAETFGKTVRATVMPANHTNEQFGALMMVAHQYDLNPVLKEIYAFPAKGGGIVPIVSIDGWLNLINSHPESDGFEVEFTDDANGEPVSCTVRMFRKDRTRPTVVTEYLSECIRATDPWKMKHRMLRHKAVIQAARYAFGFSGIYDEDEGAKIAEMRDMTPTPPTPPTPPAVALAKPAEAKPEVIEGEAVSDRQEGMRDAGEAERESLKSARGDFADEIGAAQDHDTLSDILASWADVMQELPQADRIAMQNAYEARVEALDKAAAGKDAPTDAPKPEPIIWAVAREKAAKGSGVFRRWHGGLTPQETQELDAAPDDFAELASAADARSASDFPGDR